MDNPQKPTLKDAITVLLYLGCMIAGASMTFMGTLVLFHILKDLPIEKALVWGPCATLFLLVGAWWCWTSLSNGARYLNATGRPAVEDSGASLARKLSLKSSVQTSN